MAASADRTLGSALLVFSISVFVYYTTWVFILPFVDKGHILQLFFPDKYYAVLIPALLLVGGMSVLLTFIGLVMVKSKKKTKSS